jgi:hypothetical protein
MKLIGDLQEELGLTMGKMGKYRILLFFEDTFSKKKMNRGIITLFLSGSPTSGEGDVIIYECPNPQCTGLFHPNHYSVQSPTVSCPKCYKTFNKDKLVTMLSYDATVDGWAKHLERYMRAMNMDCDIYLKRAKDKTNFVEAADRATKEGKVGADLLAKARQREDVLYTMGRIMEDTHGGQSLASALRGFLLA